MYILSFERDKWSKALFYLSHFFAIPKNDLCFSAPRAASAMEGSSRGGWIPCSELDMMQM
jgi:hypothetical protein